MSKSKEERIEELKRNIRCYACSATNLRQFECGECAAIFCEDCFANENNHECLKVAEDEDEPE